MPKQATETIDPLSRQRAAGDALATLRRLVETFGTRYPDDCTVDDRYPLREAQFGEPEGGNTEWTTSFYPGMLWLAGEMTGDAWWHDEAQRHVASFADRMARRVHIDHHDLGFLYSLACVPAWRHRADAVARAAAIAAADHLMTRLLPAAGIIQSWGDLSDESQQGRAIIDSLMNMPLLHWASEATGDARYREAATRHARAMRDHIMREDGSTFHTFYWDVRTGEPLRGATAQGYSDNSCWARGQAWAVYGFVLNHLHTGEPGLLEAAVRAADYFLDHLPADLVPYWDLIFTDGSGQERDSSAGAIAVCGLLEIAAATGEERYREAAHSILDSLATSYSTRGEAPATCLLRHGVYFKAGGRGVDEGNLWGDYYYLEALLRRQDPAWTSYWHPGQAPMEGRA
ncbi:glycoside hydrolase family 88 protein [Tessaracoccus oleiagri]|uniref:Unsaturated chondroitin disaccharide hydrolase n=1 Tax=Tessaracoccus oleiagri TaxID=686624 RepID=A0A1G9N1Y9_9ACTN|nr:glycoside hydrolase family 88 protein [Tessaracoccus oleiagri]SDL80394.1 unsaturated chondroitin disaccharide hydrolase [Tessaracoccus oleiagri]